LRDKVVFGVIDHEKARGFDHDYLRSLGVRTDGERREYIALLPREIGGDEAR
jgi:hypothetical protein